MAIDKPQLFEDLGYIPHPGQWPVHLSTAPRRVLGCGVRWGKCGKGTCEVYDLRTGRRRLLAELGELDVQAWDGKLQAHVRQATCMPAGRKTCVRIVLASGQHVELSTDHPVRTARGWVEAVELEPRELVATPRWLPEPMNPLRESDARLVVLGCLLMDGGTSQSGTTYSKSQGALLDELRISVRELGGDLKPRGRPCDHSIVGLAPLVRAWGLRGCLSKNKRLPPEYYGLATDQVGRLLSIMWSGDGWVGERVAAMTLSNRLLLEDVRHLLLRIGVHGRVRRSDKKLNGRLFEAWTLAVSGGANIAMFLEHVRVIHGRDLSSIRAAAAAGYRSDTDVVPVGRPEVAGIAAELGDGYRVVRDALAVGQGSVVTRAKFIEACDELQYSGRLSHLATSDVIWSRVLRVESIGEHDVYDLSVDEDHNFACCNVIVHNTRCAAMEAVAASLDWSKIAPLAPTYGWVVSRTLGLAEKVFREIVRVFHEELPHRVVLYRDHELLLRVTNLGGGTCEVRGKTAENPVSLLGEGLDWLICDEAAQFAPRIWESYLSQRLIDKRGWALLISTPKGKGWLYSLWQRGQKHEAGWESWSAPSSSNPHLDAKLIEAQRAQLPSAVFAQEYEAAWIEGAGQVFRNVRDLATGEWHEPEKGKQYYAGLDLAKVEDYTVLVIVDRDRRVCFADRFNRLDWGVQCARVKAVTERYGNCATLVDSTGVGDPVVEQLVRGGVRARGYQFTTASKADLVNNLVMLLERKEILLPRQDVWPDGIDELESFQYSLTNAGTLKTEAPAGTHDDCVVAAMLAFWQVRRDKISMKATWVGG